VIEYNSLQGSDKVLNITIRNTVSENSNYGRDDGNPWKRPKVVETKKSETKWTKDEDERLEHAVRLFGNRCWLQVSEYVKTKTNSKFYLQYFANIVIFLYFCSAMSSTLA